MNLPVKMEVPVKKNLPVGLILLVLYLATGGIRSASSTWNNYAAKAMHKNNIANSENVTMRANVSHVQYLMLMADDIRTSIDTTMIGTEQYALVQETMHELSSCYNYARSMTTNDIFAWCARANKGDVLNTVCMEAHYSQEDQFAISEKKLVRDGAPAAMVEFNRTYINSVGHMEIDWLNMYQSKLFGWNSALWPRVLTKQVTDTVVMCRVMNKKRSINAEYATMTARLDDAYFWMFVYFPILAVVLFSWVHYPETSNSIVIFLPSKVWEKIQFSRKFVCIMLKNRVLFDGLVITNCLIILFVVFACLMVFGIPDGSQEATTKFIIKIGVWVIKMFGHILCELFTDIDL
jgi:hypothetical protein